ncbi:MAG: FkbM family methyltransferase [Burkholderiales bacterium]
MPDVISKNPIWSRVPLLRRWIARKKGKAAINRLVAAHEFFAQLTQKESVAAVHFDHNGCYFSLADGRRYKFDPSRAVGRLYSVPFSGTFEKKETEYLKRLVRPDWVCFDVGACFGWYSILFSQGTGAGGQVHAFEPVPPNFQCLSENVALNGAVNVVLDKRALGDQAGVLKLYLPREGVSASLRPHASVSECEVIEAQVTTLDEYVSRMGIQRLDLLKADIEGAELLLLKGGMATLRKFKPTLLLEIQAHSTRLFGYEPNAVFSLLSELGYRAGYVQEDGSLTAFDHKDVIRLPDYNFVFTHPGRES